MELKSYEANAARLADTILAEAYQQQASDIHIEALEYKTRVRLRVDGLLQELFTLPLSKHSSLISRFKVMAGMDIGELRLPQDGRWRLQLNQKQLDLRLSTLPGIYGEKLVIRLLDSSRQLLSLDQLSLSTANARLYQQLYTKPNGLVLVTGPTGSGKSTTLYATLSLLNKQEVNITTLEDPVEYTLEGINQVNLNEKAGLTFSKGLRALVRQDPDIIMVGEIRDQETAELAIHAALTGHLVFSTLHTNSAVGTIYRLLDMGIPAFLLAASLRGVLAQRLVRRICPHCKASRSLSAWEKNFFNYKQLPLPSALAYGQGCVHCNHSGYKGRLAVQELLNINEEMASLILKSSDEATKPKQTQSLGTISLAQDGLNKVLQGETTLEELLRAGVLEEVNYAI